jgi:LmbE family N-acetylglucosaminyl deacetylase
MLELRFKPIGRRPFRVLCLGAHCDDIEIGCGGTLQTLHDRNRNLIVDWVVFSGTPERRRETRSAMQMLLGAEHRGELIFGDLADGYFPAAYAEAKRFCEALKKRQPPDLVLCHERDDRHQDHRVVNEVAWSTFRDHLILEYEVPKWDGGLGQPNVYVPLEAHHVATKVDALINAHRTQTAKDWFTRETFMALLRLRGTECRSPSGYAEAFHARKVRLSGF